MAASSAVSQQLPRLVILGTGWSSFSLLKNIKTKFYRVIVISPRNHFLFTPLLCSTTVGTLEFRSIIEPVRDFVFEQASDYHMAEATSVNFAGRFVECQSSLSPMEQQKEQNPNHNHHVVSRIPYDKLVIGVGALPSTFGVPGVEQHSFFLKEISDARRIRNQLLTNFELSLDTSIAEEERSRLKHVVIVGGGPTGIEFGAELYDFCKEDLSRLYKDFGAPPRVTLVEGHQILGSFDRRLQSYAENKLRRRENFSIVKANVTEVKSDCVVLNDGRVIPCGLVVWSTGLAPRPLIKSMGVEKNAHGQLLVDTNLNLVGDPTANSYAIGDCAQIVDSPLPATAQVAERQGRYIAERLNRLASGRPSTPFKFKSMGMLAYIGGHDALSDLRELKLRGFTSWLLWRSAYLTRLGSWRLRLQVPLDWLKTLLFGRDTSRF